MQWNLWVFWTAAPSSPVGEILALCSAHAVSGRFFFFFGKTDRQLCCRWSGGCTAVTVAAMTHINRLISSSQWIAMSAIKSLHYRGSSTSTGIPFRRRDVSWLSWQVGTHIPCPIWRTTNECKQSRLSRVASRADVFVRSARQIVPARNLFLTIDAQMISTVLPHLFCNDTEHLKWLIVLPRYWLFFLGKSSRTSLTRTLQKCVFHLNPMNIFQNMLSRTLSGRAVLLKLERQNGCNTFLVDYFYSLAIVGVFKFALVFNSKVLMHGMLPFIWCQSAWWLWPLMVAVLYRPNVRGWKT